VSVFKNLLSLEKSVEEFSIELKFKEGELVFILYCRYGIKKTYNLSFQECEALHALFNKNTSIVHLTCSHKLLSDCTQHFNPSVAEVCLRVVPEHALLTNFVEEDADMGKVLLTELKIANSEFERFDVALEREVTFCLKELRAILTFQDAVALPLDIYFDDPGNPIIMSVPGDGTFQGDFVMATLVDNDETNKSANKSSNKTNNRSTGTQRKGTTQRPPPRNIYRSQSTQNNNPFRRPGPAADESLNVTLLETEPVHELRLSPDESVMSDDYIPPSPPGLSRPSVIGDYSSPPLQASDDEFDLDDTVVDDALLASLSCDPSALPLSPDSPPGKRFKRLSDDEDSIITATHPSMGDGTTIVFCEDSD